jgi:DNA invertase Pin-like site-specific DNA recombinase
MNSSIQCAQQSVDTFAEPLRAVEYVRMSTDNQRYSIENQVEVIREFASRNHMMVVHSYEDYGKSGVTINHRAAFQALLKDVQSRERKFSVILVYDVSRWGRFQRIDESAYYEHICKRAGVKVIYCAEYFPNDGSAITALAKGLRRVMAAEFSRDQSVKISKGKRRLSELGFRQGGRPGFGLRRFRVGADGRPKGVLYPGERKNLVSDRVILVPGPREEVEVIWRIFDMYVLDRMSQTAISVCLNKDPHQEPGMPRWTKKAVREVLSNRKYTGDNECHKTSSRLGKPRIGVPKEEWVIRKKAFQGLVTSEFFNLVQLRRNRRASRYLIEQLTQSLIDLLNKRGRLSAELISKEPGMPSVYIYCQRFGGLSEAYAAIGYDSDKNLRFINGKEISRRLRKELLDQLVGLYACAGTQVSVNQETGLLTVKERWTLSIYILRSFTAASHRKPSWNLYGPRRNIGQFVLIVRLASGNHEILDMFLVARSGLGDMSGRVSEHAPRMIGYKVTGLNQVVERTPNLMSEKYQESPAGFQFPIQLSLSATAR